MSQEPALTSHPLDKQKLGDRVRSIADHLKHETELQIKATSHILGAAAQIAENHDQLINEVVHMVEEDIDHKTQAYPTNIYTITLLKQKFKTLREAKTHFGLKATSWAELVNKLSRSAASLSPTTQFEPLVLERLNNIESELKIMRTEIDQILYLLKQLVLNK